MNNSAGENWPRPSGGGGGEGEGKVNIGKVMLLFTCSSLSKG